MKKKDEITNKVFEMYQEYPFPDIDYKMDYSISILRFFSKLGQKGKGSYLEEKEIMEVGCGTGNTLIKLAETFTSSSFTGVDMVTNSLAIAQQNAEAKGLKNIRFVEENILQMNLKDQLDVIFCIGVLHHLADMEKGMESILKHLKNTGYLVLWLYGKHGRYRLNLNQEMLSILLRGEKDLKEKVRLTKEILLNTDPVFTQCHFNVPDSKIENKWEESLEFILKKDNWLVDQFLHTNEKTVDMKDILKMCADFKLEVAHWANVSWDINHYIKTGSITKLYENQSKKNQMLILDSLLKPDYYFLILKRK